MLLRFSLAAPRLIYLLRTSPCFHSPILQGFDEVIWRILTRICNIPFSTSDILWLQASLPVRSGGLGIRSAVQLAPSAFLSSIFGSADLFKKILPSGVQHSSSDVEAALSAWSQHHAHPPSTAPSSFSQREWDTPVINAAVDHLLETTSDGRSRARLLASVCREPGAGCDTEIFGGGGSSPNLVKLIIHEQLSHTHLIMIVDSEGVTIVNFDN